MIIIENKYCSNEIMIKFKIMINIEKILKTNIA